ncbi:MAG: DUF3786 domain-containing protein [Spirochaetaceae bacterium]|jgi:hypothetical protein|nr:DUF3786 domain-containing protein [Spirochaetaceae bacterium]
MKKGYEQTYEWVIKLLQDCDFEESSKRLGLALVSDDKIAVNFLGRKHIVAKDGIELAENPIGWSYKAKENEYNLKSVLGYYVLSEADAEPLNDFCPFAHFSSGIFDKHGDDYANSPLTKAYGNDYGKFRDAAEKLGMEFEKEKSPGQYVWRYCLLPRIPVKLVYYEGDDEYPSKIQTLYDKTAIRYYKFEPLAVLHGCFTGGLAAIGEVLRGPAAGAI